MVGVLHMALLNEFPCSMDWGEVLTGAIAGLASVS